MKRGWDPHKCILKNHRALEEQLSGPFPVVEGARRRSGFGNLTAEEQPGNLAGDRENEPCGSGPAPSKADLGQSLSSQLRSQGGVGAGSVCSGLL